MSVLQAKPSSWDGPGCEGEKAKGRFLGVTVGVDCGVIEPETL
jgi:hypothetical protein